MDLGGVVKCLWGDFLRLLDFCAFDVSVIEIHAPDFSVLVGVCIVDKGSFVRGVEREIARPR